jgi:hypothetical protein
MPKTGILYIKSQIVAIYKVCRKQTYFIATNRGYNKVCRKQAYREKSEIDEHYSL